MRSLIAAILVGLALFVSPTVAQTQDVSHGAAAKKPAPTASSPVSLHVTAGYGGLYRGSAWTPVRVTLRNSGTADVRGTLEIPESSMGSSVGLSPSFHGLYETPISLPASTTKQLTIYLPGSGIQGEARARLIEGSRTLVAATAFPIGIDSSALLIGVLSGSPSDMNWIAPAIQQQVTTHIVRLSATTLDPVPDALATFDLIVLTNVDTSQLDSAQFAALEHYVRAGGSLLLVGGPTWQQTLRPLPAALLPGRLTGTRTLPNLNGLASLGRMPRTKGSQAAAISTLGRPKGTVLASQQGTPLVVRMAVGNGDIEYLAFDPTLGPIQGSSQASGMLRDVLTSAAPIAITRTWSPQGFRARFQAAITAQNLTGELSNLPPSTLPLLALFALLTLLYVLVLGPANFLFLRWANRQYLAWATIPLLAMSYLGSAFGITAHLKGSEVLMNSVGMVVLDGNGASRPATIYAGLEAPLAGDYHVVYSASSLPSPLPQISSPDGFSWRSASTLRSTPLGMDLQEGPQTEMTFLAMKRWAIRDVTLSTTIHIPGSIQGELTIGASGLVGGAIHNGTGLDLLDPALVAGQGVTHLSTLGAGKTIRAYVRPDGNSYQTQSGFWAQLYGGAVFGGGDAFGQFGCCDAPAFSPEHRLLDRIRNAMAMLTEAQSSALNGFREVYLVGWTRQPLGTFIVDGSAPQQRSLSLIVAPLQVHFPSHGRFRLETGTVPGQLVDVDPHPPQSTCCGFFGQDNSGVSVGAGGSLTYELDLPDARRVRFAQLDLFLYSGNDGLYADNVYDWQTHRWVAVDLSSGFTTLSRPNRFVSADGRILVRLRATSASGDLTIDDPYHDVQISGSGVVT